MLKFLRGMRSTSLSVAILKQDFPTQLSAPNTQTARTLNAQFSYAESRLNPRSLTKTVQKYHCRMRFTHQLLVIRTTPLTFII